MTVKEWLKNGRKLNFEIRALKEARSRALNAAVGGAVDYSAEKVQTSNGNSTERLFVNYSQYSAELEQRISELEDYRAEMLRLISKIPDSTYRALLLAYYVNCKTWEQVAESVGYSEKQAQRKHGFALLEAEKYFEKMSLNVLKCP